MLPWCSTPKIPGINRASDDELADATAGEDCERAAAGADDPVARSTISAQNGIRDARTTG
jgi:hypothetical protein